MTTDFTQNLHEYFDQLKTAQSIVEFLALTRVYFAPENSYHATESAAAYYPPTAGEQQLMDTLAAASWVINPIDGEGWWCAKGPLDRGRAVAVEYQAGQLYIRTAA